ncbi:MAG TPA: sigma 54-interacting transcriptional regulator [Polyangiaceae bacterium]|nr:sigma 54-interacting transcriptional regulator [Polyangiaceae bacterium]
MPRLIVKGPDGQAAHTLDLNEAGSVLIGRSPDRALLTDSSTLAREPLRLLPLEAASVSANHLLAWSEQGQVCVEDLGSRNGSWLKLPHAQVIRSPAADAVVQLARASREVSDSDEPTPPVWRGKGDFADALRDSLERWLQQQGIAARVSTVDSLGDEVSPPHRIPLASGAALDIVPLATTDASWSHVLERLWRWVARQSALLEAEEQTREEGMILASSAIRGAHRDVVEAAQSDARTLLLTGASGAGKEMLAEVFHRHSGRSGAFVAVNCAMFSKDLLRSELFGAEPGSFTGASRRIIGAVERAQGGTLFLDEIGEVPAEVQPMLLRFLDRRELEQLGQYGRARRADVRVVAATNRDLRDATRSGAFRADLWYRLSVHVVDVPSLRVRWDDIETYLRTLPVEGATHSVREAFTPAAFDLLRNHPWEGNFRELTNFVERLPRGAAVESISVAACQRALERGSLKPVSKPSPIPQPGLPHANWAEIAARAVHSFVEDHDREPSSWDDQKEWNEKYLKPLIFFHLSGAASQPTPMDDEALTALASRSASQVQADRGTAAKQLARYFERYGR